MKSSKEHRPLKESRIMRDAQYQDALILAKAFDVDPDRVWRLIKSLRFATITDLAVLIKPILEQSRESDR
jgi:hypothetical protein